MNQTRQKGKKTNFGPGSGPNLFPELFLWVSPLLYVKHCYKLSLYAI